MTQEEKVKSMLTLQQKLNNATNGENWELGKTKNGKKIDWRRCAYLECAELIESMPWKHWKNISAEPDYENIKIEAVDIWHFIMSEALTEEYLIAKMARRPVGNIESERFRIETIANRVCGVREFESFVSPLSQGKEEKVDYYTQIETAEELIKKLINGEPWGDLVKSFLAVAAQSGLNIDLLYSLYIGKNVLNQFRQDHGYKAGTYIKIWNGEEDNVSMQRYLEKAPNATADELYEALKLHYPGNAENEK